MNNGINGSGGPQGAGAPGVYGGASGTQSPPASGQNGQFDNIRPHDSPCYVRSEGESVPGFEARSIHSRQVKSIARAKAFIWICKVFSGFSNRIKVAAVEEQKALANTYFAAKT